MEYEVAVAALVAGCGMISSGLEGIGIGHKLEKASSETKE
jgi:hypothetical protein